MPPASEGEPLSPNDIALLKTWIDQGAAAPHEKPPEDPRKHWAFRPPIRPALPAVRNAGWVRNPIDAFIAAAHDRHGLQPAPSADKTVLLRRVYLDLIGLPPTRAELHAFLADNSPDAYEKVVDRLLASAHYGERWGRHWMDVWRYSDWYGLGDQVRNSRKHVWHWRDWIIESLNEDKGYDQMIVEMLAADELAPTDARTLRATGYLVRNWYLFNRTFWLQDTVEHTAMAFLGLTIKCARCHDHKFDPVAQRDYYRFRAFFEPHQVRDDRLPGEPDRGKDALPRVYDSDLDTPTYLFRHGNEKDPDTGRPLAPGVPAALGDNRLQIVPIVLPLTAYCPDKRDFVVKESLAATAETVRKAKEKLPAACWAAARAVASTLSPTPLGAASRMAAIQPALDALASAELDLALAEASHAALVAVLGVEHLEDAGKKDSAEWKRAATEAANLQRQMAVLEARKGVVAARQARVAAAVTDRPALAKKEADAEQALTRAEAAAKAPSTTAYTRRVTYPHTERFLAPSLATPYPKTSTGRRLALARWIAGRGNPLTARVAVNHIWLRHFGAALVPSVFNFGRQGQRPSHPELLDWLALEFMDCHWSMKDLHRLIVTSNTYRMQSGGAAAEDANGRRDEANRYLWRMNPRRMEAELVRDSALYLAGRLDATIGGPEIDLAQEMVSRRRGLYFRHAQDIQLVFFQLFDAASVNECYRRDESIVPQQALALENSTFMLAQARRLAERLSGEVGTTDEPATNARFIQAAFEQVLGRLPTTEEYTACGRFLELQRQVYRSPGASSVGEGPACPVPAPAEPHQRARASLVHVLLNHNDFVTIR
jgi:hypothetical protein